MRAPATPAQCTVVRFLSALAGHARPGELLELRYRLDDGERMGQLFEPVGRLQGLATAAVALGRRTDVYVGCAPRSRRHGGRESVQHAFVLWADCDGEDAVSALARFDPQPAIIIASGTESNRHAYWPLTEPLARDELERANRRLAHALRADPASADGARILRPPATKSHKHQPPAPVDALRLDPECRVRAPDIVGGLKDPPGAPRCALSQAADGRRSVDWLLAIAPSVYVERLLGVAIPPHRKVPCPFHSDTHPSLHVYDTPARGWYCFGCRRGGSIYDLAAELWDRDPRGREFLQLRSDLEELLGVRT